MAASEPSYFPRFAASQVETALLDSPIVLVSGPRQSGKTTLVKGFADENMRYLTLDDDVLLAAARQDPVGFIRGLDRAIIDEAQRAPELMRALKRSVDEDRRAGRFILTGSADLMALPRIADSLAGRMALVTLLPLSPAEIARDRPQFLMQAFQGQPPAQPEQAVIAEDLMHLVLAGGFPEMLRRDEPSRRRAWARDYLTAVVQRDVRDIAQIDKLDEMTRLARALAELSGQLLNFQQLGAKVRLSGHTVQKYTDILERLFLLRRLEPWYRNSLKRLLKTPKLIFLDSGLLASMRGLTVERLAKDRAAYGALLETFVASELMKQAGWNDEPVRISHMRDKDGVEVDLVIENDFGDVVGIEVKAAASVKTSDFKGLRKLAAMTGDAFTLGVVLYDGDVVAPFGNGYVAAPVSALWQSGKQAR